MDRDNFLIKTTLFVIAFSSLFYIIHYEGILPKIGLQEDFSAIIPVFSAINLIFSVISAFVIQFQWHKWNNFLDATRGEVNMLRQLSIVANHFPEKTKHEVGLKLYNYLTILITESTENYKGEARAKRVEKELGELENSMFTASEKHADVGRIAFGFLTRAIEFRERKLQVGLHHLPLGLRLFLIFSTCSVIFFSLFIYFQSFFYNYLFTLTFGLLAFGVYLVIDDLDHPYRPSNWPVTLGIYKELKEDIEEKFKLTSES